MKRWRVVALFAVLTAVTSLSTSFITGRAAPDEIRARSFVLVNGSGEVMGRLGEVEDWGPVLSLQAKRARATVMVGSMGEDAGVAVVAEHGTAAHLAVGANGGPALGLTGAGKSKLIAGFKDPGGPTIALFDSEGLRVSVSTNGVESKPVTRKP
jgi:hypothetical protein